MNFIFKFLISFVFLTLFFTFSAFASKEKPLLVIDESPSFLPKNFRMTSDELLSGSNISTVGLSDLHVMGSGQFSIKQLKRIIKKIPDPIVVDLRQESHGFINGIPVSWYGEKNWENHGKNNREIRNIESTLFDKLNSSKTVMVYKDFKKRADGEVKGMKLMPLNVKIASSEKDWVRKLGLRYHRFFIPDHYRMTDEQVDQFVKFVKTIPNGEWVYFHCRGGRGRTSSLMTMYDMIKNAKSVSLSNILEREELIGGKDLNSKSEGYKSILGKKRLELIKRFYEYCRTNTDNFQTSWTSWLKLNSN